MHKDPAWKRVVGGLVGVGVLVAVILVLRAGGASGEDIQRWQEALVIGAAIAAIAIWIWQARRKR